MSVIANLRLKPLLGFQPYLRDRPLARSSTTRSGEMYSEQTIGLIQVPFLKGVGVHDGFT
jgi:hypothetical protein